MTKKKKKIEGSAGSDASPNHTPRTKKTKKSKKSDLEKENISVVSGTYARHLSSTSECFASLRQRCREFSWVSIGVFFFRVERVPVELAPVLEKREDSEKDIMSEF